MKLNLFQSLILLSSTIIIIFLLIILKWLFKKVKGPLGQKNKFLSLDVSLTFCVFTIISLITLDPLIIFLSAIPTFLIMKNKLETSNNWLYQLILSMFIGMSVPISIYWFFIMNPKKVDIDFDIKSDSDDNNNSNDHRSDGRLMAPELSLIDLEDTETEINETDNETEMNENNH